jgi:hypothetical protein
MMQYGLQQLSPWGLTLIQPEFAVCRGLLAKIQQVLLNYPKSVRPELPTTLFATTYSQHTNISVLTYEIFRVKIGSSKVRRIYG